jgi:D-amino-acid dehydrogenase
MTRAVCVIGAGIVGCAAAYRLARAGHAVTLVDAAPGAGLATSFANGAQLSYSYVEPFASPATLRALPKMLLARASPVKFRPQPDWRQWDWGLRFLWACRPGQSARGTRALLALAALSRRVLDAWRTEEGWDAGIGFAQDGKLVLCPDAASLRRQAAQVRAQAAMGGRPQQVLPPEDCRAREPALRRARIGFEGGVWTADEAVVDPHRLCLALAEGVRRRGGRVLFDTAIDDFERRGSRLVAALGARGRIAADAFVLACGPASPALAARLGLRLPMWPIKGYSLTLPFLGEERPRASVTHLGLKTVFAPLGERLRVAAMAEIAGHDRAIPRDRVDAMLASVDRLYPGLCELREPVRWAGLRPATPDSVPIVGRWRDSNLFLDVGHGALGLTLAAGSAERIAAELA